MNKIFFTLLLCFLAATTGAQTVTIPDSVARWFLEQNEKVKIYEVRVSELRQDISILESKITQEEEIIKTYEKDSSTHQTLLENKRKEISSLERSLRASERELRRQKFFKVTAIGAAGLLFIILLFNV